MAKPLTRPERLQFMAERGTRKALKAYARHRSFRRPDGEPDVSAAVRELIRLGRQVADRMREGSDDVR